MDSEHLRVCQGKNDRILAEQLLVNVLPHGCNTCSEYLCKRPLYDGRLLCSWGWASVHPISTIHTFLEQSNDVAHRPKPSITSPRLVPTSIPDSNRSKLQLVAYLLVSAERSRM